MENAKIEKLKCEILGDFQLRQLLARPTGGSLATLGNTPPPIASLATPPPLAALANPPCRSLRSPNPVYMTVEDP